MVVVAPSGPLFGKTISNMQEIIARGGKVILLTDEDGVKYADEKIWKTIELPKVDSFVCPILYAIPIQLIGTARRNALIPRSQAAGAPP